MAKLTDAQRDALPDSAFAGPNRTCPIHDVNHARAALSLCAGVAGVREAIARRYPGLEENERGRKKVPSKRK